VAPQSIIEKVKKLMRLAENAGTEHEAALAHEKAQRLMVEHAIDEIHLTPEERERVETRRVEIPSRDEIRRAKLLLLMGLTKANRCRLLDNGHHASIVGFKSDVDFVELLYASVMIQYAGERPKAWKAYQAEVPPSLRRSRHRWVNAFAWAYMDRVGERLAAAAARDTEEVVAASAPGTALVLASRAEEVDAYMAEQFPQTRSKSIGVRGVAGASGAGRSAADRADLSGGRGHVGGGRRALQ